MTYLLPPEEDDEGKPQHRSYGYREVRPPGTIRRWRTNESRPRLLHLEAGGLTIEVLPVNPVEQAERNRVLEEGIGEEDIKLFEPESDEVASLLLILNKKARGGQFGFSLTMMTEWELIAFRDAVAAAVEEALPIARKLDEDARTERLPNRRLYRTLPAIRTGDGSTTAYLSDVREPTDKPPQLVWPAGHQPFYPRGDGEEVADAAEDQ